MCGLGGGMTNALIRAYKAQPFQPYPEFLERLRHNLRSAGFSQRPQVLVKQRQYLYLGTSTASVPPQSPQRWLVAAPAGASSANKASKACQQAN